MDKELLVIRLTEDTLHASYECETEKELFSTASAMATIFRDDQKLLLLIIQMLIDPEYMEHLRERTVSGDDVRKIFNINTDEDNG